MGLFANEPTRLMACGTKQGQSVTYLYILWEYWAEWIIKKKCNNAQINPSIPLMHPTLVKWFLAHEDNYELKCNKMETWLGESSQRVKKDPNKPSGDLNCSQTKVILALLL